MRTFNKNIHHYSQMKPSRISRGLHIIGLTNVKNRIQNIQDNNLPLISIGSGNGLTEKYLEDTLNIKIICVDPKPNSWLSVDHPRMPEYDTVHTLIKKQPDLIGRCNLMIMWPYYGDNDYDIESIRILKPMRVLILLETSGGSGSFQLLSWLIKKGIIKHSQWIDYKEDILIPEDNYILTHRIIRDVIVHQYTLLTLDREAKDNVEIEEDYIEIEEEKDCVIS